MHIMRPFFVPIVTVLSIFIFFYLFSFAFGPLPIQINSTNTTTSDLFSVSAVGEAEATAQNASFTVGVTQNAETAEEAQTQVNTTMNQILSEIRALGIEDQDIQTQNINVNPQYDFIDGTQVPQGYTASQNVRVKATVDLANQALDEAVANGANVVNNITFELDDEDQEALEAQARNNAIEQAKQKAQTIADAAGLRLGRIVNVQEYRDDGGPMPFMAQDRAESSSPEIMQQTELQPGEDTIRMNVTLSYETL